MITVLSATALLLAAFLVYAAAKPNHFRYERSASINAAPEKIFPFINDLQQWASWSPYEKYDPAMKRSISANSKGKGAVSEWDGNNKVGKGRMEVLESTPPSKVVFKLEFFRPFKACNTAEFTLEPQGGATRVTWAMSGPTPFMAKVMGLLFNCEKMVSNDFSEGLANLKALAEK